VRKFLILLACLTAGTLNAEDLCKVLARPMDFAGDVISIRASVKATMHGTYLRQSHCADSILVVLPEEILQYRGSVHTVKDAEFEAFLKARLDHRPDAPVFEATFSGQLEYSARAKFGYYKRHRTRLVLQAVQRATAE
jgi:hypothetical protein